MSVIMANINTNRQSELQGMKGGWRMVYEVENTEIVKELFDGWEETLIWSCLQRVMGKIYTTDVRRPVSAMAVIGDFAFLAGRSSEELALYKPECYRKDFTIMVPRNDEWSQTIERIYGKKAKPVLRYAIKKEKGIFDRERLRQEVLGLPKGYTLCLIDEGIFQMCRAESWCEDLVSQFKDYAEYEKMGLGAAVLRDGEVVSGASSYTRYQEGIEIEIDTREDFRRKGLAYSCGAKLILECLKRNLYPSWDAQNKWSVSLAEKLGYHFSHEYKAYEIWGY